MGARRGCRPTLPWKLRSACYHAWMQLIQSMTLGDGLRLSQFQGSDHPGARAWVSAMEMGFNSKQPSEKRLDAGVRLLDVNDFVATEVTAADDHAGMPVATYGVFYSEANLGAGTVKSGMVTTVTVRPSYKRRGIMRAMMELNLGQIAETGAALALLTASDARLYGRFGFQNVIPEAVVTVDPKRFQLKPSVLAQTQAYTVDWVLRDGFFDLVERLACQAHLRHRGSTLRDRGFAMEHFEDGESGDYDAKYRGLVCYDSLGEPSGYAVFSFADEGSKLDVRDMDALSAEAELALWGHLANIEGVREIKFGNFFPSSPLRLALEDSRAVKVTSLHDLLWARVLDVQACFGARSYSLGARLSGLSATFRVDDPLGYTQGVYRLALGVDGASVEQLVDDTLAEATVSANALAELVYSSSSVSNLRTTGMIQGLSDADMEKWESLFAPDRPATFRNPF